MANNDWAGYLAFGGGIPALLIGWWLWMRYRKAAHPEDMGRTVAMILMLVGVVLFLGGGYAVLQTLKVIK